MNNTHNNGNAKTGKDNAGKDGRLLDAELDQLDQLYRSEESVEPPDLLDQAILNKASRAVEPKNSWLDFGWIHAVTTVALVVLTFSIFTTLRQTGEFEPTVGKSSDRAPSEASSGNVSSGEASESAPAVSSQVVTEQEDAADVMMTDQAASPAIDAAGTSVSDQRPNADKEETRAETRPRDQDSLQRQMRAPVSAAPELEIEPAGHQQKLLEHILVLKHAGDDRWIKELADFKKLYPDYPLPEDLKSKDRKNKELENDEL